MKDLLSLDRPAPPAYSFSAPFWEATRDRKLLLQFCRRTGKPQFYPRPTSIFTGRRDIEWREVSGRGTVYTYTIARIGAGALRGCEPYIIANVELDEGVNILGNLTGCAMDEVFIGMRVRPSWQALSDGRNILMFEPDADPEPTTI